jgi:hypothetical protein
MNLSLISRVYGTAMCYALRPLIDDPLIGINFNTFNMPCHHLCMRIALCHVLNVVLFSGVFLLPSE